MTCRDNVQGTTGKELMKLTEDILTQIGIKNPLHRMQLINTRNDLIAQQEQDTAVSPSVQLTPSSTGPVRDNGSPVPSKPSSPSPSFAAPQHSPKVSSACHHCNEAEAMSPQRIHTYMYTDSAHLS